ncbi:hypothetical protein Sjap_024786 [Stephania japonica]|uniref:Bet v I/Major latex protein domain-containing protein n=1 Tax=Stephania japonica TaxID=461633 RepID=A0AAP0EE72_9MAGN
MCDSVLAEWRLARFGSQVSTVVSNRGDTSSITKWSVPLTGAEPVEQLTDNGVNRVDDRTTEQTDGKVDRVDNRSTLEWMADRTRSGDIDIGISMAQLSRQRALEVENEVKCPAGAFYDFMKSKFIDAHLLFPEIYKDSKVLEGDGKSLGSVIQWSYVIDAKSDQYQEVTAKLTEVDDEKRSVTFTIVGGDLSKIHKSLTAKVSVTPKSNGSIVKWSIIYEKLNEDDGHHLDPYLEIFAGVTSKFYAHFQKVQVITHSTYVN